MNGKLDNNKPNEYQEERCTCKQTGIQYDGE